MKKAKIIKVSLITAILLLFIGCTQNSGTIYQTEEKISPPSSKKTISYQDDIQPIFTKRCVVCHGCYDAPCQLKLSSIEGVTRGASKKVVYKPRRSFAQKPTRLHIDADSTEEWRKKGFYSVLGEDSSQQNKMEKSLLYKMLALKQKHPLNESGKLDSSFKLDLDRKMRCVKSDQFSNYENKTPRWGMPYGMPNLTDSEHNTIVDWIAQNNWIESPVKISQHSQEQIKKWENFFNQSSKKQRLVSRYIYEHLFLAHIYFEGSPENQFFRLVRSSTNAPQAIREIAANRPYDEPINKKDPNNKTFYYRLRPYNAVKVIKEHKVYRLSDKKLQRYQELFIEPEYMVSRLPKWGEAAANPLKTFREIPPRSRYKFLLDNAFFFTEGFIKGPVCRGQVALSVIEDHFWLTFFDPDADLFSLDPAFLDKNLDKFRLPAELENNFKLDAALSKYYPKQKKYVNAKIAEFKKLTKENAYTIDSAVDLIWDGGEEKNPNAALTVFRHFDSSSVSYGLNGEIPKTTWIIDFPLLERIHYLLVAGFDVFGNVGHQLTTRLYMDFLRMEGEDHFLAFLPVNKRKKIRDSWYVGVRNKHKLYYRFNDEWQNIEAIKDYDPVDPQKDLNQRIIAHLQPLQARSQQLNQCNSVELDTIKANGCRKLAQNQQKVIDDFKDRVTNFKGRNVKYIPDVIFLRVNMPGTQDDLAFSIIHNKAYENVTFMFEDEKKYPRDYKNDSLTILDWLEGSYPNFFLEVEYGDLEKFGMQFINIESSDSIEKFVSKYGIRRTSPTFWQTSDWFHDYKAKAQPVRSGVFDLNRYRNL